jgi:hypothetical protein
MERTRRKRRRSMDMVLTTLEVTNQTDTPRHHQSHPTTLVDGTETLEA